MYERFTDRARKIMELANQEAQRLGHEFICTEHILLGLVLEGSGVEANILKNLQVDLLKIREEVEKLVAVGPPDVAKEKLPLAPMTKRVIDHAITAAHELNHNYIGSEHLLVGLLREPEGVAAQVLAHLGFTTDKATMEIITLLGSRLPIVSQETTIKTVRPRQGPSWRVVAGVAFVGIASAVTVILLRRFFGF